jgi:uncharacterized protein (TIGR03437 family)
MGLTFFAGTRSGLSQDISIPASVSSPGASVLIAVVFTNNGWPISGLQFDVAFDSTLSLSTVIGDAARGSGKSLHVSEPVPNKARVLIWEFNQNPIPDGTIVILFVNVAPAATLGVYPIHFEAALATDPNGQPVPVSATDGTLTLESLNDPAVVPQGVLNGASLLPGPVAPGEIITIMGPTISSDLSSKITSAPAPERVTFNGLPAPLINAASDQVNAVVPFGIAGRTTTTLAIANLSGTLTSISLPVALSAPGIFTQSGSGAGRGAILNQDSTTNSPDNPAGRGSIIVIYATGAGQTDPPGIDGLIPAAVLPRPALPVSVQVGGVPAEILYAGAAPGQISGVLQVNCRVPMQVAAGTSVPVLIIVGEATSQPVTVAVK